MDPMHTPSMSPFEQMQWWTYQIGGYLLLHVLDDPAWLALMFC
jgi:hypothetical protein